MESLLEELHTQKDRKSIEKWTVRFERELEQLEDGGKNFYLLLLAEIFAVNLRNLSKAQEYLKKVDLSNDLIIYEHRLRLCYFRFLEGDYDEAINDLTLIKVTIENSIYSKQIAMNFFNRIVEKRESDFLDEDRPESVQNRKEDYQFEFIKALKFERSKNIENAKRSHIAIYDNFGDLSESIKYEAAKHLLMLQVISKGKQFPNQSQYEKVVATFQKGTSNKEYYYKKLQYLNLLIDILEDKEVEDQIPIKYDIVRDYVIQMIDKNIDTAKDNSIKTALRQVKIDLQKQSQANREICFNFLGEKTYKQLLKKQDQQKAKAVKIKQSSLKPTKAQHETEKPSKIKITASILQRRQLDDDFTGSYMTKINMNSGGYQQRYFYFRQDFRKTKKLYYCNKAGREDDGDDFYRLRGFKKIEFGKKTKALNRKQCEDFEQSHCFTLKIQSEDVYERNFYVKQQEDLHNWIALFQTLMEDKGASNIKKTVMI